MKGMVRTVDRPADGTRHIPYGTGRYAATKLVEDVSNSVPSALYLPLGSTYLTCPIIQVSRKLCGGYLGDAAASSSLGGVWVLRMLT